MALVTIKAIRNPCAGTVILAFGALLISGCDAGQKTAAPASVQTSAPVVARGVQHDMAAVWPQLGQVWPGVNYKDRAIVVVDGKNAWAATLSGVHKATAADLKKNNIDVSTPLFISGTWNGKQAMLVNARTPTLAKIIEGQPVSRSLFIVATHEMFHSYEQGMETGKPWRALADLASGPGQAQRGTQYPLQSAPRLYRASAFNALRQAYLEPQRRDEHLAAAAYWHEKWTKQYPVEAAATKLTDITEGSARYLDARVLQRLTGTRDDAQGRKIITRTFFKPLTRPTEIDTESYRFAVAGLILDQLGRNWKGKVSDNGKAPAEILLSDVSPKPQQPANSMKETFDTQIAARNKKLAATLDPVINAYRDTRQPLLQIPTRGRSYDPGEYYLPKGTRGQLASNLVATFKQTSGTVEFKGRPAFIQIVDGEEHIVVPFDQNSAAVSLTGNQLKLTDDKLTGTVTVKAATDATGRKLLVAQ